ncbi:MAG: PLDc N-terminal domain-containing protein [Gemmatimonadota bacterium]
MRVLAGAAAAIDHRWVLVILLAALDIWSITFVVLSGAGRREKVLWSGVILLCPIVGCLFWFVLGPKRGARRRA